MICRFLIGNMNHEPYYCSRYFYTINIILETNITVLLLSVRRFDAL